MTKNEERNKANGKKRNYTNKKSETLLKLMVKGTTDETGRFWDYYVKSIQKEHPTDKGYFKKMYVLTDKGRRILEAKRKAKSINKINIQ